jgi:predicted TIM-barrel fold metal-dependent hydrolase
MRLDIHTHFNSTHPDDLKDFVKLCESLETRACIHTAGPRCDKPFPNNDIVLKAVKPYSNVLIPFAFVDLWEKVEPNCVERFAEQGFRGLKCITPYHPYDHDLYMPVYEAAEKFKLPMLFHTGLLRPSLSDKTTRRPMVTNMNPLRLDRIARSFPDLKIVMAHMGTTLFRHEAAQLLRLHPNLYSDLAGSGAWMALQPRELSDLLAHPLAEVDPTFAGFKKLVLGSDAYLNPSAPFSAAQDWYAHTLQRVGVPKEIVSDIMGGTVAGWLGLA